MKTLVLKIIMTLTLITSFINCAGDATQSAAPAEMMMEKSDEDRKSKKKKAPIHPREEGDFSEEDPLSAGIKG